MPRRSCALTLVPARRRLISNDLGDDARQALRAAARSGLKLEDLDDNMTRAAAAQFDDFDSDDRSDAPSDFDPLTGRYLKYPGEG